MSGYETFESAYKFQDILKIPIKFCEEPKINIKDIKLIVILFCNPKHIPNFEQINELNPYLVCIYANFDIDVSKYSWNKIILSDDFQTFEVCKNNLLKVAREYIIDEWFSKTFTFIDTPKEILHHMIKPFMTFDFDLFKQFYVLSVSSNEKLTITNTSFYPVDILMATRKNPNKSLRLVPIFYRLFANVIHVKYRNYDERNYKKYTALAKIENNKKYSIINDTNKYIDIMITV